MILTTAQLDTAITALREYATRYARAGYEQYADEVYNAKELVAILEANRQPYEDTRTYDIT